MIRAGDSSAILQSQVSDSRADSLLVFADDWGRHPSSAQHLIRQLTGQRRVYWANTIGMRPPRLNFSTLSRGWQKVSDWIPRGNGRATSRTVATADCSANPVVLNPRMWPWFRSSVDRRLNARLLTRQLQRSIDWSGGEVIGITTLPIVADIMDSLPVSHWVYYCVDDFSLWPGLDHRPLRQMEATVVEKSSVLIAASAELQTRLQGFNKDVQLLTHGVDLQHWHRGSDPTARLPTLTSATGPLIVFWGVVDRRLDLNILEAITHRLPQATVLLVGPQNEPDPRVYELDRVELPGPVPYEQLPQLAQQADVLIMPYADLPVTRAMQPLKLLEYLATDRPVIVSNLPANRPWQNCLAIAEQPAEFAELVATCLQTGLTAEHRQVRQQRLALESWTAKAAVFSQALQPHPSSAANGHGAPSGC